METSTADITSFSRMNITSNQIKSNQYSTHSHHLHHLNGNQQLPSIKNVVWPRSSVPPSQLHSTPYIPNDIKNEIDDEDDDDDSQPSNSLKKNEKAKWTQDEVFFHHIQPHSAL